MPASMALLTAACCLPLALSVVVRNDVHPMSGAAPFSLATVGGELEALSTADMGRVFARSEEAHLRSIAKITKSLTIPKAIELLHQGTFANASGLEQIAGLMMGGQLRAKQPSGYSGIDGARKLLNDMIFESLSKYDAEIAKCEEDIPETKLELTEHNRKCKNELAKLQK